MKLIEQSWVWVQKPVNALQLIENAGRTCYKTEAKDDPEKFVKMILNKGHESVIEHVNASVLFITNRGVTHELVRHRLAAYSQESTRYVNYKNKDIEFITPVWLNNENKDMFVNQCQKVEEDYNKWIDLGYRPEQAREILTNALKTEIVITCNLREWRHIFKLRTSKLAHPQMRDLMLSCLIGFKEEIPIIFEDIYG